MKKGAGRVKTKEGEGLGEEDYMEGEGRSAMRKGWGCIEEGR